MKRILQLYKDAFGGLSDAAWMLALVMLINRSGAMVVPFLSVYLTNSLHFSIGQAGMILSCFGLGSMAGAFLGGGLSDRYGHFVVQFFSLMTGGVLFIILSGITSYYPLMAGIFILSVVAESLRPANAASVAHYARPENISRAFSLNRMALNLGFSIGPALGGLLAAISYRWLFIADGITCMLAGIVFYLYFRNRKGFTPAVHVPKKAVAGYIEAYRDKRFMFFVIFATLFAILFFQLFLTLPLYYRDEYFLAEGKIGGLLALNGLIVFASEMIMVYVLNRKFALHDIVFTGMLMVGISFAMLNLYHAPFILVLSMILLSFAEILVLPFLATYVVQRSNENNRGAFMGLYTLSFSMALVMAPYIGATVITHLGYPALWWGTFGMSVVVGFGLYYTVRPASGLNK